MNIRVDAVDDATARRAGSRVVRAWALHRSGEASDMEIHLAPDTTASVESVVRIELVAGRSDLPPAAVRRHVRVALEECGHAIGEWGANTIDAEVVIEPIDELIYLCSSFDNRTKPIVGRRSGRALPQAMARRAQSLGGPWLPRAYSSEALAAQPRATLRRWLACTRQGAALSSPRGASAQGSLRLPLLLMANGLPAPLLICLGSAALVAGGVGCMAMIAALLLFPGIGPWAPLSLGFMLFGIGTDFALSWLQPTTAWFRDAETGDTGVLRRVTRAPEASGTDHPGDSARRLASRLLDVAWVKEIPRKASTATWESRLIPEHRLVSLVPICYEEAMEEMEDRTMHAA